jgi:cystathionine beta-lyase
MHIDTKLAHLGRRSAPAANAVNPPLVKASTAIFATLADFKAAYKTPVFEAPRYGRSGTSTNFELQEAMAQIEGTETCLATSCGLSAIVAVLSSHSGPGKHILLTKGVYGPTQSFCDQELTKSGTQITYFSDTEDIQTLIQANTSLIYLEVPASLTMELFDIKAICDIARQHKIRVACDSTWGTPIFFRPHELGVDISIHAATKYICGHSDVMMGLITGSYEMLQPVRHWCNRYGSHVSPDACWLTLRGLRTLAVRMFQHQTNALEVATWLTQQPQIKKVIFPPLYSGRDHLLFTSQFSGCAGPFTVELRSCKEQDFENFINGLSLFGLGTSWGGFESLVMPAIAHELRTQQSMPEEGRLVRFHIGLENPADLCDDIQQALAHILVHI